MPRTLPRRRSQPWNLLLVLALVLAAVAVTSLVVRLRPPSQNRPIQIVSAPWAPYVGPDLPDGGPMAQLVSQVFQREGYTPEVTFSSWSLGLQGVDSGGALGVFPMVDSAERHRSFIYSDALVEFRYVLFFDRRREPVGVSSRSDLRGTRIARIEGYDYWPELDGSGAEFVPFATALQAFEALRDGRVDLVPEGLRAGQALLGGPEFVGDASGIDHVRAQTPLTHSSQGLQLLMKKSQQSELILTRFNRSLAAFKQTDDYRRIVASLDGRPDRVELVSAPGGAVPVVDDAGDPVGAAPPGTPAVVHEWPPAPSPPDSYVRVKMLQGPLAGRVGRVRLSDVRMVHHAD